MTRIAAFLCLIIASVTAAQTFAASLSYSGRLVTCSAACDSINVLSEGSGPDAFDYTRVNLWQGLPINDALEFTLPSGATTDLSLWFRRFSAPTVDPILGPSDQCPPPNVDLQLCNFDTVNPLNLSDGFSTIAGTGMSLADGTFSSGQISVTLTQEPFVRNDTRFTVDLITGDATLTMLDGAVTLATFEGTAQLNFDSDGDGVMDLQDNCIWSNNPSQYDSNGDGFGNICDGDVNNDCFVNSLDLAIFRFTYFTPFADTDFNGDGHPGVVDLGLLRTMFFQPPGPSGIASCDTAAAR